MYVIISLDPEHSETLLVHLVASEKGTILEVLQRRETEIKFDFSLIVEIVHIDKVTINNWKIFNGIKTLIFNKNYMFLEIFYDLK